MTEREYEKFVQYVQRQGEPGFVTFCPVMIDECCQAVYNVLDLLDAVTSTTPGPIPNPSFAAAHPGKQNQIRGYILDTLLGRQLKSRTEEHRYRNAIIVATIKRTCEAHQHNQGHH